jgi:serine/threonine protein kinase
MNRTTEQTVEKWLERHAPIEASGEIPDGAIVDGWRIAALVARGGSGEVYRAVHTETGQVAALKILHRDDDVARTRFALEIRLLSENSSPFLPAFFGAGEYMGRPWCAMEFLEPFPLPSRDAAVASFVTDVCRAAAALHARGYVHRDIKPANILSRNGVPVLLDLGLAKATGGSAVPLGPALSIVDGHAVGVGTPGYSAPEQFTGGDISPAADIHAIGVLASTCFGGRPPSVWRKIIRRATSSLPDERYPNVDSLARAVRLRHLPIVLAIAAAAVVAVVALLAVPGPRRSMGAQNTQPEIRNLAEDLGRPLGLSGKDWLTSQTYPWQTDPDIPGAIRSGNGIRTAADSTLSIPVDGPACVSFRYRRHFAGERLLAGTKQPRSFFKVSKAGKELFQDLDGDIDFENPLGEERSGRIDLPAGHHRLSFTYTHGGTGYIDHFNGVHLLELRIEPGAGP